jgi:hypothetical protein
MGAEYSIHAAQILRPRPAGLQNSATGADLGFKQVQVLIEHLPVQLRERLTFPAALAENSWYHFGCLHCAYLMVPSRSSPVPLRPVVRYQRSPDWADVTPPTTAGTPSP